MSSCRPLTILYFSPSVSGGIAEYSFYQASALEKAGAKIISLRAPSYLNGRPTGFETVTCLVDPVFGGGSRLAKRIKMLWRITANQWVLAWQIWKHRPQLVLLDSYVEYFSPFWVWPHWLMARLRGVRYAANLHDPVRNFAVGPAWWHKLSVRLAYLPLEFVLVHDKLQQPSPVPPRVRVVQVPHGLYEFRGSQVNAPKIRQTWGADEWQKVFLSFGYVRDSKNLDLVVHALADVPDAFLVVSGSVASAKDKPFNYYRELAAKIGVAHRCYFAEGFVADDELGNYFDAADYVLLTYAATFHSQSGVLNLAARARKPVLASAAPSPLIESVENFQLGVVIKPDSFSAVVAGMRRLLAVPPSPHWDDYEAAASWGVNAQGVLQAVEFQTGTGS